MTVIFTLTFIALAVYVAYGFLYAHEFRAKKMEQRDSKSFDQIFEESFREQAINKDKAHRFWLEMAKTLKVDPMKLRPSDRFSHELNHSLAWFPLLDLNDEFAAMMTALLHQEKLDASVVKNWSTVKDYVVGLYSAK